MYNCVYVWNMMLCFRWSGTAIHSFSKGDNSVRGRLSCTDPYWMSFLHRTLILPLDSFHPRGLMNFVCQFIRDQLKMYEFMEQFSEWDYCTCRGHWKEKQKLIYIGCLMKNKDYAVLTSLLLFIKFKFQIPYFAK